MNLVAVMIILAAAVPISILAVGAAFWFVFRQSQKHELSVLDRFLSRNMSEYGMTDLLKKEIEADQDEDQGDEVDEDKVFDAYMANRSAAVEALGTEKIHEVVG